MRNEQEEDTVATLREGLASLFLWWYGNHKPIRTVLQDGWRGSSPYGPAPELPVSCIEQAWRERWFAKGELTAVVDRQIAEQFAWLLDEPLVQSWAAQATFQPSPPIWERLALMILFDQVTRNVLRGKPEAYAGDQWSLPIALQLAQKSATFEELPFHFQATVCICLCHSESGKVQDILQQSLEKITRTGDKNPLFQALTEIQVKHAERIQFFGHFPERNGILGRCTTDREAAYLAHLYLKL